MNNDVEEFYITSISNHSVVLRSRWFSGLKMAVFGGSFRYRIGTRFVMSSFKIALPCGAS